MAKSGSLFVRITARTKQFSKQLNKAQREITKFANTATVSGAIAKNALISLAPAIAPATAGLVGLGGAALSSFGAASAGAAAFGSLAVTSISKVNAESKKLQQLQQQLANTKGAKERAKILQQISKIQDGLTGKQKEYLKTVKQMGTFWNQFAKQFEDQVLGIAINGIKTLQTIIEDLKLTFAGSVSAVEILGQSLRKSLKSEPVQRFFDFLDRMAGPTLIQLGQGIGYAIQGILNLMVAFEPLAKKFNAGFLSMMQSFAAWSAGLETNQGFQKFVNYVTTNGPILLSVLGEFSMLIINILIALAPLGAAILPIIQNMLQFTNSVVAANPQLVAIIFVMWRMIAVMRLILPVLKLLKVETIKTMAAKAKAWLIAKAKVVKSAAVMVANIIKVMAKYTWMAVTMVAKSIWWTAVTTAKMIAWAAKQTALVIGATAKMVGRMAWTAAKFIAKYAWMAAKALFNAARIAASWFIALGPIGWVIATVIALVALIIANWDKVKSWTIKTWNKLVDVIVKTAGNIWDNIKETFNNIVDFILGLKDTFLNAGKGLIEQMAKGIENAAGKVISKVKALAQKVRDFLPFSPAKVGPLSDLDHLDFGGPIKTSISKALPSVQSMMGRMLSLPKAGPPSSITTTNQTNNQATIHIHGGDREEIIRTLDEYFGGFQQASRAMG